MARAFVAAMVLSALFAFTDLAVGGDGPPAAVIQAHAITPSDVPPPAPVPVTPPPPSVAPAAAPATLPGLVDGPDGSPEVMADDGPQSPEWYPLGRLQASGGAYLMKPYFTSNPAYHVMTVGTSNGMGPPATTMVEHDSPNFSYGLDAAPFVCLTYPGEDGFGLRGRWWYFDQDSRLTAANSPAALVDISSMSASGLPLESPSHPPGKKGHPPGKIGDPPGEMSDPADQFAFGSSLRVLVFDLEATQEFCIENWMLTFSAGGRYAHLAQNYDAWETSAAGTAGSSLLGCAHTGHSFDGGGPTVSAEVMHRLGNTRLSFYGDVRGSILYGDQRVNSSFDKMLSPSYIVETSTGGDSLLPVIELELGIQYTGDWGDWKPIVRAGLVSQTWFNAGNATSTGGNLGFLGLMTTAGFAF